MVDSDPDPFVLSPIKRSIRTKNHKNKIKNDDLEENAEFHDSNTDNSVILIIDSDSNDKTEKISNNTGQPINFTENVYSCYKSGDELKAISILTKIIEEISGKDSNFGQESVEKCEEIILIAKSLPQLTSNDKLIEKIAPLLLYPWRMKETSANYYEISLFAVNYLYSSLQNSDIWPSCLVNYLIESKNHSWVLNYNSSEFVVNLITAFQTILLNKDQYDVVNNIANSCTIINADKDQTDLLSHWSNLYWTCSKPRFSGPIDFDSFALIDKMFNIKQILAINADSLSNLKDEKYENTDVCILIIYLGLPYMRNYAISKMSHSLILGRNVKLLSLFIATFIINLKLSTCQDDSESLSRLLNLKIKPIFHEIMIYFIQQHIQANPQDMTPLFDLVIFRQIIGGNLFPPLFISVIKYCLESQQQLALNNLAFTWQRSLPYIKLLNSNLKILLHQIIRSSDFNGHISKFFGIIFDNFDKSINSPEFIQASLENKAMVDIVVVGISEQIAFSLMALYYLILDQRQSLPSYNSLWSCDKYLKPDSQIFKSTVALQSSFIQWLNGDDKFDGVESRDPIIITSQSYCKSIKNILFMGSCEQYVPYQKLNASDIKNWEFVRCQLFYQIFENHKLVYAEKYIHSFFVNILNYSMKLNNFLKENDSVIEIFESFFIILLKNHLNMPSEIDSLTGELYLSNLIERLWLSSSFCDPCVQNEDKRIIKIEIFWKLIKTYLCIFTLSPVLVGETISKIPTMRYLILSLITSNFNDVDMRKICQSVIAEKQFVSIDRSIISKFTQLSISDSDAFMAVNIHDEAREIPSNLRCEFQQMFEANKLLNLLCESQVSIFPIFLHRFWDLLVSNSISEIFVNKIFDVITNVIHSYIDNLGKVAFILISIYLYYKFSTSEFNDTTLKVIAFVKIDIRSFHSREDGLVNFIVANLHAEQKISIVLLHMFFYFLLNLFNETSSSSNLIEIVDSYEFDEKYTPYIPNILSAISAAISMDTSFNDLYLHLKMLSIISSSETPLILIILDCVYTRHKFFACAFEGHAPLLELVISLVSSNWKLLEFTQTQILTTLFILSHSSASVDPKFKENLPNILNNISDLTFNKYIFEYNFILTNKNIITLILSRNDTCCQTLLLRNIKYSDISRHKVNQLFEILCFYGMSNFAIEYLLQNLKNTLHEIKENLIDIKNNSIYKEQISLIIGTRKYSETNYDTDLIVFFSEYFNISSVVSASSVFESTISNERHQAELKPIVKVKGGSKFHQPLIELANIDLSKPDSLQLMLNWNFKSLNFKPSQDSIMPFDQFSQEIKSDTSRSSLSAEKIQKILIDKDPVKGIRLFEKYTTYQIVGILSCQEIANVIDFVSGFDDRLITKLNSSNVLDLFDSLYKRNSIWKHERFINDSVEFFKKYDPYSKDDKFCTTLLKLLFHEINKSDSIQSAYDILNKRKFLWCHVFHVMEEGSVLKIFLQFTCEYSELNSDKISYQWYIVQLTYLYLNLPVTFHEQIYNNSINLNHIYTHCVKIIFTIQDKNCIETFKNCINSLRSIESLIDEQSNLILFCRIIKEHPLIITRHAEFILASIKRNLKHLSFLPTFQKSKFDAQRDFERTETSPAETLQSAPINDYLYIFIRIIKVIKSYLPVNSFYLQESEKIIQNAQRLITSDTLLALEYDNSRSQKVESFLSYLKTFSISDSLVDIIYDPSISFSDVCDWLLDNTSCSIVEYKKYLESVGDLFLTVLPKIKHMPRFFNSYINILYSLSKNSFVDILKYFLQETISSDSTQKIENHPFYILAERRYRNFYSVK